MIGAGKQKKASRKAEAAQIAALQQAIDLQNKRYDANSVQTQPFVEAGTGALSSVMDLLGLHGDDVQATEMQGLKDSPLYEALYRNGEEALLQNGAATGGLRGGNMQRGLADFGADTFSKVIQNQLANLMGLSTQGLGAVQGLGALGQNNANAISGLFTGQGDARAQGAMTRGGIAAGMWNSAGGMLDKAASAFIPGGSGLGEMLGKC